MTADDLRALPSFTLADDTTHLIIRAELRDALADIIETHEFIVTKVRGLIDNMPDEARDEMVRNPYALGCLHALEEELDADA